MIRMHRLSLLCLLPLAACAGSSGPAACTVRHLTDVPITLRDGAVTISAQINSHPVTMLLDTTVERSSVTPETASNFNLLEHVPHSHVVGSAIIDTLDIAGQNMWNRRYVIKNLGADRTESGVIGIDWLQHFDVEIDLSQQRIGLYQAENCSGRYIPWNGPYAASAATQSPLMVIPVFARGRQFDAQIDTAVGASLESRSASALRRSARGGVRTPSTPAETNGTAEPSQGSGFVLPADTIPFTVHDFSDEGSTLKADVIFGTNYLRTHRVWLSYGTQQVFSQPSAPRG